MQTMYPPYTRIPLDPIGIMAVSNASTSFPGNFWITAHLKETINVGALQLAVDRLFERFPLLNGKIVTTETAFYHEILPYSVKINRDNGLEVIEDYYNYGDGHVIRILYGDYHIKIEAIHSITDGSGLCTLLKALLTWYFFCRKYQVKPG